MWENKRLNLGVVKEREKIKLHFKSKENLKNQITYVKPCCGSCTSIVSIDTTGITAVFDVGDIPAHLNNIWEFEKCIVVNYKDFTSDTLTFKGIVKR